MQPKFREWQNISLFKTTPRVIRRGPNFPATNNAILRQRFCIVNGRYQAYIYIIWLGKQQCVTNTRTESGFWWLLYQGKWAPPTLLSGDYECDIHLDELTEYHDVQNLPRQQRIIPSGRNGSVKVNALCQRRQRHPGGGWLRARRQYHASRSISPSHRSFTIPSRSVCLHF